MEDSKPKKGGKPIEEYVVSELPFYLPTGEEIAIFKAAYANKIPFAAIGPTGCGKTRFIHRMSYDLNQKEGTQLPIFFVTCHEDLTATDLLGRDRITGDYLPGILPRWAETGGILYLDEVVEARPDLATLLHPMMEPARRVFYNERTGKVVELNPRCMLTMSWNPGYQNITKRLKVSTKQRLVTYRFDYAPADKETEIVARESGVEKNVASALVELGKRIRGLKEGEYRTLQEGASTRLLIDAGILIKEGIDPVIACRNAIINCLTEDIDDVYKRLEKVLEELTELFFPK